MSQMSAKTAYVSSTAVIINDSYVHVEQVENPWDNLNVHIPFTSMLKTKCM